MPTSLIAQQEVEPVNGQPGYVSADYVQALRAERNNGRHGAIMKEILHATVVSHRRTPDKYWNARSLHIPALWMTFYSSVKQCVGRRKFDDTMKKKIAFHLHCLYLALKVGGRCPGLHAHGKIYITRNASDGSLILE